MPGLTSDEKAQIRDHLGYPNIPHPPDYVYIYVNPALDGLTDEASLTIIRAHLDRLNNLYTEQEAVISKFKLDKVGNIQFCESAERRLWSQYRTWVSKLGAVMDIRLNPDIYGSLRRSGRAIV